jgi:hypothetical protein
MTACTPECKFAAAIRLQFHRQLEGLQFKLALMLGGDEASLHTVFQVFHDLAFLSPERYKSNIRLFEI